MKAVTDIFNLLHVNIPFLCLWFSNKFEEVQIENIGLKYVI